MIRVYVAGPLTVGDWGENIHLALGAAQEMRDSGLGIRPVVPHLSAFDHLTRPRKYEHWMTECMDDVRTCDVVFRLAGDSPGADREVSHALSLGKGVFYDMQTLLGWAMKRAAAA